MREEKLCQKDNRDFWENIKHMSNKKVKLPTVSCPRNFIMFINDLTTTAPIYKYVDDSTIFELFQEGDTTQIQESA